MELIALLAGKKRSLTVMIISASRDATSSAMANLLYARVTTQRRVGGRKTFGMRELRYATLPTDYREPYIT